MFGPVKSAKFVRGENCKSALKGRMSAFRREERGSILIMSLFFLVLMLMVAGMAVDLMRAEMQRAQVQSTLDRAVLAGAALDQKLESKTVVESYFKAAKLDQYLSDVTVDASQNSKRVMATAHSELGTFFMRLVGVDKLAVPAIGGAEESLTNIEISLVVDVSGSMTGTSSTGNSKMFELRKAAKNFVYHMQCNPDDPTGASACTVEPDSVSISLVPYAEQVLVGETLLQQFNVTNEHTLSSCADFSEADFTKAAIPLDTVLKRAGSIDNRTNHKGVKSRKVNSSRLTCRTDSYRKIMPISNSYSDLQAQIETLKGSGYTSIDMGMKWGTALLDPSFQPAAKNLTFAAPPMITSAFENRPFSYTQKGNMKVVVLMTDGENTTQYVLKDAYRSGAAPIWVNPSNGNLSGYDVTKNKYYRVESGTWENTPDGDGSAVQMTYPEFWATYNVDFFEETFAFLGQPTVKYGYSDKNTRLDKICTAAKDQGIKVYTIGFETTSASNAIMRKCASDDSLHFDVDGLNLGLAFESIARDINQLRLIN